MIDKWKLFIRDKWQAVITKLKLCIVGKWQVVVARLKLYLVDDWRRVVHRAWSFRLSIIAALFTAVEMVVPLFGDVLPRGVFILLAFAATIGAAVARLVAQPKMRQ